MTQQGPAAGGGSVPEGAGDTDAIVQLTRQLRSDVQAITQGELRRQERLVQFDRHLVEIEESIRDEVARLRTTGSAIEALSGDVRDAVDGLARLGFDPTNEQLAALRHQLETIPQPDLEPLHDSLRSLHQQLAALPSEDAFAALSAAFGQVHERVHSLETPNLLPLQERIDQLHVRVGALSTRDLVPLRDALDEIRSALSDLPAALPTTDLTSVHDTLARLQQRLDDLPAAIPAPDLTSVHEGLHALQERVGELPAAIPSTDLTSVHETLARLQQRLDDLPAAIPAPDLASVHEGLQTLHERIGDLPAPDDTAVREGIARVTARLDDLRMAVEQLPPRAILQAIATDIVGLAAQIDRMPVPDDTALVAGIDRLTAEIDSLRTAAADRFDALPGPDHITASLQPVLMSIQALVDPGPVLHALELSVGALQEQMAALLTTTVAIQSAVANVPDPREGLRDLTASSVEARNDLKDLTEQVRTVTRQTAPIDSLASGLNAAVVAIAALQKRVDEGAADTKQAAEAQELALARVVASADGLSASVGALRSSIGTAAQAAGAATVADLSAQVDERLRATETHLAEVIDERVHQLDPEPLRERIEQLSSQMTSLPLPDLSPVAEQMARLSATVTSQARAPHLEPSDLEELGRTLAASIQAVVDRIDSEAARARGTAASLAASAEAAARRDSEVDQRLDALAAQVTEIATALKRMLARPKAVTTGTASRPKTAATKKPGAAKKAAAVKKGRATKKAGEAAPDRD